jgi:hypothetical protein
MEDVLEVYHRPYDEKRPLVCIDEASKQLVGEVVRPLPPEPGQPGRFDYEYTRRHGQPVHDIRTVAGLAGGTGH